MCLMLLLPRRKVMLKMEARTMPAPETTDSLFDAILVELVNLHESLPLDEYLLMVEDFADQARRSLAEIPDHDEQDRLRDQYRQVIAFAMDITCGNLH